MIKNILCPVDRSRSSLEAFGYAVALARWQGARLNLLEVIEVPVPAGGSRVPEDDGGLDDTLAAVERDLKRALTARRASDVNVNIFVRRGIVVEEILAQAEASRTDLVVIGRHGRGSVQRLVLGSVAEKVLRRATCPVLTVCSGARAVRPGRPLFGTILCATDFSAAANSAVAYARRLAKEADARLAVMHAVDWPFGDAVTPGPIADLRKSLESGARNELLRLLPRPGSSGPRAEAVVTAGKASVAINRLARARGADLIVMGVSGRDATDVALLGSTTHHVIREGKWPVLTVRTVAP